MKYILCVICIITYITPCDAAASVSKKSKEKQIIEKQARKFFLEYTKHLNQYLSGQDLMAVKNKTKDDIRLPSHVIQPNGSLVEYSQTDEIIEGFTGFLKQIQAQGVAQIQWQDLNLTAVNDYAVLAENTAVLMNKQGDIIQPLQSVYVLHRDENNWAIILRVPQTY